MKRCILIGVTFCAVAVADDSNIDIADKFAWAENVGWTNWRDAGDAAQGVVIGPNVLSGFIWGENIGHVNVGDGAPEDGVDPARYDNTEASDFGVNVDPDGTLHGFAWAENVGWINFDGGALADPAQPARIDCTGRLQGYVWGENIGWINLDDETHFVAMDGSAVPQDCDVNDDGDIDGVDIQLFVDLLISGGGGDWRQICAGDLDSDDGIDLDDVAAFVACLLE